VVGRISAAFHTVLKRDPMGDAMEVRRRPGGLGSLGQRGRIPSTAHRRLSSAVEHSCRKVIGPLKPSKNTRVFVFRDALPDTRRPAARVSTGVKHYNDNQEVHGGFFMGKVKVMVRAAGTVAIAGGVFASIAPHFERVLGEPPFDGVIAQGHPHLDPPEEMPISLVVRQSIGQSGSAESGPVGRIIQASAAAQTAAAIRYRQPVQVLVKRGC
jgi:hypothetical protein